jgi:hypothetical protein
VLEDRVLRRIFGPKREEGKGDRRKLHYEELVIYTHHQVLLAIRLRRMS